MWKSTRTKLTVSGKLLPRKLPPGIVPPISLNIPNQVFKIFCFSLLSPLSLIYLKDCFVILCFDVLKALKSDFFDCYILKKKFCSSSSPRWTLLSHPSLWLIVPIKCLVMKFKNIKYFLLKWNLDSCSNLCNIQLSNFHKSATKWYSLRLAQPVGNSFQFCKWHFALSNVKSWY